MKLHHKIFIFSFFYYLYNLIIYYSYERSVSLDAFEKLKRNSDAVANFNKNGISIESIKNLMLPENELFNPFFNFGWSFGSWHYWIISSILSFGTILIFINSKKSN